MQKKSKISNKTSVTVLLNLSNESERSWRPIMLLINYYFCLIYVSVITQHAHVCVSLFSV